MGYRVAVVGGRVGVICGFPKMKVALLFNLKSTDHLARSVINDLDDLLIENE